MTTMVLGRVTSVLEKSCNDHYGLGGVTSVLEKSYNDHYGLGVVEKQKGTPSAVFTYIVARQASISIALT